MAKKNGGLMDGLLFPVIGGFVQGYAVKLLTDKVEAVQKNPILATAATGAVAYFLVSEYSESAAAGMLGACGKDLGTNFGIFGITYDDISGILDGGKNVIMGAGNRGKAA